jgi:type I restriction enzyme M protein
MAETETKKHGSQQSVNGAIKSICDIMRRANCQGAMQYVPELTWILFLRILDEMETQDADNAEMQGREYQLSLESPYRWCDWAAKKPDDKENSNDPDTFNGHDAYFKANPDDKTTQGWKRYELQKGKGGDFINWVNGELIPYLKGLENQQNANQRQKVISEIMSGVENTRIDSDYNLLEIFDKVHTLSNTSVDDQHVFALSQVYEGLLLSMGEKGNDGGQFFTPREVIRMMIKTINPQIGQTVYDPCCGTGGFLAQAMEFMAGKDENGNLFAGKNGKEIDTLKHKTFYGWEKDNQVYPIALANLILHSIDLPQLCHGNTLLEEATYDGLFKGAPATFDVILTNPPFGGKEGKEVKNRYKTGATQICFLTHVQEKLKTGGKCAIVMDEGVLFRTNESGFVDAKRRLLSNCNLWCIVSLPAGVFTSAGAGVKTNVLFFTEGTPTEKIWYYDCSSIKVGKRTPLTLEHFNDFFELLPSFKDSENSWTIDFKQRKQEAEEQATPLDNLANEKRQETVLLKTRLKDERKQLETQAVTALEQKINELEKEINELDAKAKTIRSAIYDLKAVNPNITEVIDNRTPQDLIDFISQKGDEVASLLKLL